IEVAERIIMAFEERRSRTPIGRFVRWSQMTNRRPTLLRATCEGVALSLLTPVLFGLWPTLAQAFSGQAWNWNPRTSSSLLEVATALLVPGMVIGMWTSVGAGVLMHAMDWERVWPMALVGTLIANGCVYATTWVGVRLQRRAVLATGGIIWVGLSVATFLMIQ